MGAEGYSREHTEAVARDMQVTKEEILAYVEQEVARRKSDLYLAVQQFFEQCDIKQFEARTLNIHTLMDHPAFTAATKHMTKEQKADVQHVLLDVLRRVFAWKTVGQTEGFNLFEGEGLTLEFARNNKERMENIRHIKDWADTFLHELLGKNTQ